MHVKQHEFCAAQSTQKSIRAEHDRSLYGSASQHNGTASVPIRYLLNLLNCRISGTAGAPRPCQKDKRHIKMNLNEREHLQGVGEREREREAERL